MVPHLITAFDGPINELEQRVLDSSSAIERWFRLEWMEHTPPITTSVDIRNAGYKLAPVDTNLFPNGWCHLSEEMLPLAVQAAQAAIEKICPEAHNLLIVPENCPPASFYAQSLACLRHIFAAAGLNVRFGSIDPHIRKALEIKLPGGESLLLEPAQRVKGRLMLKHFDPCTILLANDLAAGAPGILEDLHEQFLLPPLHAGWSVRRKSTHFRCYEDLAKRFGKLIGIDPWLINPLFGSCGAVDLTTEAGVEQVRAQVDALLTKVRRKCKEYGIADRPFVAVKVDNGSGGMGIMTVRDAADISVEDARQRAHAIVAEKSARGIHEAPAWDILVQEGVITHERINQAVAEPVVYMIDRYVVGGYYRIHAERGVDENLNAPGAQYVPLAFAGHPVPQHGAAPGASAPNRFYMYGVVGRLAMLAASYELETTDPLAEDFS